MATPYENNLQDMTCTICNLNLMRENAEPVRTSLCEHLFCKKCLKRWHQRIETTLSERDLDDEYEDTSLIGGCPICRSGASKSIEDHQDFNKIMPIYILHHEFNSRIRCAQQNCNASNNNLETFLFPCGHHICNYCNSNVGNSCPTCQTPIEKLISIPENIKNYLYSQNQNATPPQLNPQQSLPNLNNIPVSQMSSNNINSFVHFPLQTPQYLSIDNLFNNNYSNLAILQYLSQKYFTMPSFNALNIFLSSDGNIFTYYTEDSNIFTSNKNDWTLKQKIQWNILLDILSKICTDPNTTIQSFYLFNFTPKLLQLCISIFQKIKTILDTRRNYHIPYPYYTIIFEQHDFKWRSRVLDVDNTLPWILLNNTLPDTIIRNNNSFLNNNNLQNEFPDIQPILTQKLFEILIINANSEMLNSITSLVEKQWKMIKELREQHNISQDNNFNNDNLDNIGEYSSDERSINSNENVGDYNSNEDDLDEEENNDIEIEENEEINDENDLDNDENDLDNDENDLDNDENDLDNDELIAAAELTLLSAFTG
mgnify:CR=1 FL=1